MDGVRSPRGRDLDDVDEEDEEMGGRGRGVCATVLVVSRELRGGGAPSSHSPSLSPFSSAE